MHPCRTVAVALIILALVKCHALTPKRVLVVGGSGRVGASTVRWIEKLAKAEQLPVELAVFAALALAGARGAGAADVPRSGGGPTCGAASRNASATSGHVAASSASQFGET